MAPKHVVEVLSSVPKRQKAVTRLEEKTRVLDKLPSVMSYGAVSHEFSVNESTIDTLSKVSLNGNT